MENYDPFPLFEFIPGSIDGQSIVYAHERVAESFHQYLLDQGLAPQRIGARVNGEIEFKFEADNDRRFTVNTDLSTLKVHLRKWGNDWRIATGYLPVDVVRVKGKPVADIPDILDTIVNVHFQNGGRLKGGTVVATANDFQKNRFVGVVILHGGERKSVLFSEVQEFDVVGDRF